MPDKFLNGIPFAALLDHRTQRYLLEDHPVSMAQQASLLLDPPPSRRPQLPPLDRLASFPAIASPSALVSSPTIRCAGASC